MLVCSKYRIIQIFIDYWCRSYNSMKENWTQYFTASILTLLSTGRELGNQAHFESLKYNQSSIMSNGLTIPYFRFKSKVTVCGQLLLHLPGELTFKTRNSGAGMYHSPQRNIKQASFHI